MAVAKCLVCWRALLKTLGLLSIAAHGFAADKDTRIVADSVYLQPQRLVAIEKGRRLNLYCIGKGSPTVVFDSGLGDSMMTWALTQPAIATETRTCSYDRAGLGFSDPASEPRTSANMVEDLQRLLRAAHLKPPYVLVGHSLGGMNIKLYAELHLSEVAGLVFVDPAHEDFGKRGFESDPEAARQYARYLEFLHECLKAKPTDFVEGSSLQRGCATLWNSERFSDAINAVQRRRLTEPGYMGAWVSERENALSVSSDQLRAARRSLGDIPLIVLSQEEREGENPLKTELHTDIAKMSTSGVIRAVRNSGHCIQLDQPQEVNDAVLEVVHAVRTNRSPHP